MKNIYQPLISVIVATYNSIETIERCIQSVLTQTYPGVELIIIDGGSSDGTVEIIKKYDAKIKYWVTEPDRGIYHAWNKALPHADGDWICFIGSDDSLFSPLVIESAIPSLVIAHENEINVVYGSVAVKDHNGQTIKTLGKPWHKVRKLFKQEMCIPHPGLFHRKEFFDRYGYFNEDFKIAGDYEFLLRELAHHQAMYIENLTICSMSLGGVSSSLENIGRLIQETRRAKEMHSLSSCPFMYGWLPRAMIKFIILEYLGIHTLTALQKLYQKACLSKGL